MTPRPNETPDPDEIPGFDETHEPNETPEPSKTTGPNRTPDSNEITESNETLEINRTLESNETPELNETHESNENSEPDKDPESDKNPKSKKKKTYLKTYSSIALSVMFMLWFASAAAQDCFGEPHHTQPRWLTGTTAALGCPLAIFALVYVSHWKFVEVMKRWVSTFILGALVFLTLGSYLIGRLVPCHTSSIMPQFITAILAAAWCGIALWFSTEALRELRDEPGNDDRREKVEIISAWYFFCLNFATALIYYMYSYNPAGTAKPHWDWEEWLG
ncbi:hypothetical protein CGLO_05940 [Colletotrichum gloeosporioides Cg-14]|uniref:Uncharacterized protein n=1 Tax=Colletotrichum gloeosporioides (strain Cg-14) TaxID=1237896 RepID=T0KFN2_COLGC|nr:hypothetical protein CGLO_05940 [Colletotrichum gloeosporioides Cg-14]